MTFPHTAAITAALSVLAAAATLTACGSDDTRDATSVGTSTSGRIVADTSTDLGNIDTTNRFLEVPQSVDWSETDQLDIAATADAPVDLKAGHSSRVYLSVHVDCR